MRPVATVPRPLNKQKHLKLSWNSRETIFVHIVKSIQGSDHFYKKKYLQKNNAVPWEWVKQ